MIKYLVGDATDPQGSGPFLLPHICNARGKWGKGYVLALSARWPEPEQAFREWASTGLYQGISKPYQLGEIQFVNVEIEPYATVVNMVAQDGYRPTRADDGKRYTDYEALRLCLNTLAGATFGESIHMPRIGAGLGGSPWEQIEDLINETLIAEGLDVFVYDLS